MARAFSVKITGDKELADRLAKINDKMPKAIDDALHEEAMGLEAESAPLSPVSGIAGDRLRDSTQINQIPKGYSVGYYTEYAIYVHEMGFGPATAGKIIRWSTPGTGAKFLQRPFEKRLKGMTDRLRRVILKRLGL